MFTSDHPDCCGVAARLPKKPGIQKLTPPSSANDACETNASAAAKAPVQIARVGSPRLVRACVPYQPPAFCSKQAQALPRQQPTLRMIKCDFPLRHYHH